MVKTVHYLSVNSPSSATKPKSRDNQPAGASSGSSQDQSDEDDPELETGSCEQSIDHVDIKRHRRYSVIQIKDYENWSPVA